MASQTLKVDMDDVVLQELSGSKGIELELGRQAFIRIWNDYNFKVKTYQESLVAYTRSLDDRASAVCVSPLQLRVQKLDGFCLGRSTPGEFYRRSSRGRRDDQCKAH